MSEQFYEPIISLLEDREGEPMRIAELADRLNIAAGDRAVFEEAVEALAGTGRIVFVGGGGAGRLVQLPAMGNRVKGTFRQTMRGFGFVVPDEPNAHGDLFIP